MSSELSAPRDRAIVLDANILTRAALGSRVPELLSTYAPYVTFMTTELAFAEADAAVRAVFGKRGVPPELGSQSLEQTLRAMRELVDVAPVETFNVFERAARRRLANRDEADWPYLAMSLVYQCPIWTEDQDFFGRGVATWITELVEIYLNGEA